MRASSPRCRHTSIARRGLYNDSRQTLLFAPSIRRSILHVTIITLGSRGDVQPYLALGLGLRRAGHVVRVATHSTFRGPILERGLDFAPVEGNPRAMLESKVGQEWLASGRNPI